MSDSETTIESLRSLMRRFVAEREWEPFHTPRNLAASVAVEAGELLELFQWTTPDEAAEKSARDPAFRQAVADEIADVTLFLLSMCNACDLDLSEAVESKMQRVQKKYPPEQFKGRYERPLGK